MDEEEPLSIPVIISKHGVKVKKTEVKKKDPSNSNERVRDVL